MVQAIHVFCARPGMIRGGRENPFHAVYAAGDHTPEQFRELLADPLIAVVSGEAVTEAHMRAMEPDAPGPDAAKPGRK